MNIAIVIDIFDNARGGGMISTQRIIRHLKEAGHNVTVIATGEPMEGKVVVPSFYLPFIKTLQKKMNWAFGKPEESILRPVFEKMDLIHVQFPFALGRGAIKLANEMGIPVVASSHLQPENMLYNVGLHHASLLSRWFYKFYIKTAYNHVDHIHCPSRFSAEQLKKHGCKANLHVISNGILPGYRPGKTKKPLRMKDHFVILTIGRLAKDKRHIDLIKAVNLSKYAEKIQIIISGGGPLEEKLRKQGSSLPNLPLVGYLSNEGLMDALHYADLYVHTSEVELESMACLEAIGCGLTPVISDAKTSATQQFALDDRSLFKGNNPKNLARKIDYWIEHSEELTEANIKYAEYAEKFYISETINKLEEMYNSALGKTAADKKREKALA